MEEEEGGAWQWWWKTEVRTRGRAVRRRGRRHAVLAVAQLVRAPPRKVSTSPHPTPRRISRSIPPSSPPATTRLHLQMALASRCCARLARSAAPSLRLVPTVLSPPRRWNSSLATDPKISGIVDQISGLTLLETADLVSLLKVRCD